MSTENLSSPLLSGPMLKLWKPGTISLMTIFLGFPSGIVLSSINWIRLGSKVKAVLHLIAGILVLWAMVAFSVSFRAGLVLLVNVGFGLYLNAAMRRDIDAVGPAGIQYSHWMSAMAISLASLGMLWIALYSLSFLEGFFPGTALYHTNRGDEYSNQGNYDLAVTEYTQAIELEKNQDMLAILYYYRGLAFYNKGDRRNAITDFSRVIELKPAEGRAFLMRGVAYSSNADYESAVTDLTRAIQIDPKDSVAYYDRGLAFASQDDFRNAVSDFSQVIQMDPNDGEAYFQRGLSYENLGSMEQAIHDFENVLELTTTADIKTEASKELLKLRKNGIP